MVTINKSFVYGTCFASFTWLVSLYLYWQLTKSDDLSGSSRQLSNSIHDANGQKTGYRDEGQILKGRNYVNSDKLRRQLQPILRNSSSNSSLVEQELTDLGMVKTINDQKVRDEGYKQHAFNVLISNKLNFHRPIPDTRNKLCNSIQYPDTLPVASVVICFFNEHITTLLRSVHSILDRSPPELLKEVVLVDDFSNSSIHSEVLEYISQNLSETKVKLFRTERREGLIRARIFGSRKATGEVLVFLDSHIEVNVGWMEPLLAIIKDNISHVPMPVIDIINPDTFKYTSSPLVRGGFNWGLHFKWENLPTGTLSKDEDFVKPIKSPTMAGGLFAINRKYFVDIGEYDAGMNIWGGENLEISFRIWMCGGELKLIPCSRVGHIFRHRRPYGDPHGQDTMTYNSLRVAHVWMDEYKEHFISQRKNIKETNYGDISARLQLRKELKCKDFDWYVKNVYPELTVPTDDQKRLKSKWSALEQEQFQPWHSRKRNYIDQYRIRLTNSSLCVESSKDSKSKGSKLVLRPCRSSKAQIWYETDKNEIVLSQLLCLQSESVTPILYKCHEMGGNQEWKHKGESDTPIYNMAAGTCLGVDKAEVAAVIAMKMCTGPSLRTWDLIR